MIRLFISLLYASVLFHLNPSTGAIDELKIAGDSLSMNWTVSPDGKQYAWIGSEYAWGLGRLKADGKTLQWTKAETCQNKGKTWISTYTLGDGLTLTVTRSYKGKFLVESYAFRNRSNRTVRLQDIEINTPFNDNYPNTETCLGQRCHAHIWTGDEAAYVCVLRMGARPPHLGLMLTEGSVGRYAVRERDRKKAMSNTRGILCLMPDDTLLLPGKSCRITWKLFAHNGWDDFFRTLGTHAEADRYVARVGEKIRVKAGRKTHVFTVEKAGDNRFDFRMNGRKTHVEIFGLGCEPDSLLDRRAFFILRKQRYENPDDIRHASFLPYDNETGMQIRNWLNEEDWGDWSEGRERVGMGLFLARWYRLKPPADPRIPEILESYAAFVRNHLQESDYKTWGCALHKGRHRIYNYPWITHLYCEIFECTHDIQYLKDAYGTQMAAYRYGGYNFYTIDVPVRQSLRLLRENGMQAEADSLLEEYRKAADTYVANGVHFPKFEVNYEQSIVAPATLFLCEMYLETGKEKYLKTAEEILPLLEAFNGRQPSAHLHDIAIRHWDGYWFGKRRCWGDTFPHYWSDLTADCFAAYAECTQDNRYAERAKAITMANLINFTPDGRGSCAYLYPDFINGEKGKFSDPLANDQDWALMFYLKINR